MIEGIFLAAVATAATVPAFRYPVDDYVMVSNGQSVSTELLGVPLIGELLSRTVTTYQYEPLPLTDAVAFVSPVKRSISITATIEVGGRIVQPPIEDEIVYFDE